MKMNWRNEDLVSRDECFEKNLWVCGECRRKNTVYAGQMWQLVGRFNEWRAMGPSSPKRKAFTKLQKSTKLTWFGLCQHWVFYLVLCPWILRLRSHYPKILKVNIYIDSGFAPGHFIQSSIMADNAAGWVWLLGGCAFLFGGKIKLFSWVHSGGVLRWGFAKY